MVANIHKIPKKPNISRVFLLFRRQNDKKYNTFGSFQRHFRPESMSLYDRSDDTLPP